MSVISIGEVLTLDTRTRELKRSSDGRKVTLNTAACLCLTLMTQKQGEMIAQDELIYAGWQQMGIEVSSSSLRVTINMLRRAFTALRVDESVMIVTFPRQGYRFVIQPASGVLPESAGSSPADKTPTEIRSSEVAAAKEEPESAAITGSSASTAPRRAFSRYWYLSLIISAAAGLPAAGVMNWFLNSQTTAIDYIQLPKPLDHQPENTQVFVDKRTDPANYSQAQKTLDQWLSLSSEEKSGAWLYINIASDPDYSGLFSCRAPLGEVKSECRSYVFDTH